MTMIGHEFLGVSFWVNEESGGLHGSCQFHHRRHKRLPLRDGVDEDFLEESREIDLQTLILIEEIPCHVIVIVMRPLVFDEK